MINNISISRCNYCGDTIMKDKTNNKYYALIITYQPSIKRIKDTINTLQKQGFKVIIVDNCSNNNDEIKNIIPKNQIIVLGKNYGIARALNVGMKYIKDHGGQWVLSCDQDTIFSDNMLDEYKKYIAYPQVGALCPRIIRVGEIANSCNLTYEIIDRCPTSGFFMKVDLWESVGGYDNWMFIDYVDYDMCKRINNNGYLIYRINSTYIKQELGKLHIIGPIYRFGRIIKCKKIQNFAKTYNHSPVRNYYFVRNALYYLKKYRNSVKVSKELSFVFKWELKKILLEPDRIRNIKSIIKGVKDYRIKTKEIKRDYT